MLEALMGGAGPLPSLKEVRAFAQANPNRIDDALPCWTGTIAAYAGQGRTFRESAVEISGHAFLEYVEKATGQSWCFPVPGRHLDVADGVLLTNHGIQHSLRSDGGRHIILVDDSRISLLENFPVKCTYYLPEAEFGTPAGAEIFHARSDTVYLWRSAGPHVGLVAAGGGSIIDMKQEPSWPQGVVSYA